MHRGHRSNNYYGNNNYYNRGGRGRKNYNNYNNKKKYYDSGAKAVEVEVVTNNKPIDINQDNNYYQQNYQEVEIEYIPKEVANEMKSKGNTKIKEVVVEHNKILNEDLLDDANYHDFNEDDFESLKGNNTNDNTYEDSYEDNYNYNNYNDNYEDSYYNSKNPLTFKDDSGFTQLVDEEMKKMKNYSDYINLNKVNVLMIAEKPSIARMISQVLSNNKCKEHRMGRGKCLITFNGDFKGVPAKFTVSAVAGHVYGADFLREHNKWDAIDAGELYNVPTVKLEANRKANMPKMLQKFAQGQDILCLWLDCDPEGENICYEVIYNVLPYMNKNKFQQIYRAKFSSLTKKDLKYAFDNLYEPPNKNLSLSVDCRQVMDLKIGVSFTRFLTSNILPGLTGIPESTKILSYGPCQTPTLWFCVNREKEINTFKSQLYYKVYIEIEINKFRHKLYLDKCFYNKNEVNEIIEKLKQAKEVNVDSVEAKQNSKSAPVGLNTVNLLKIASSYLKMSPHQTMVVAENLYTKGYITYPRTETTKYSSSFDFKGTLSSFSNHPTFKDNVKTLLNNFKRPPLRGVDAGDHPPITPSRVANQNDLNSDNWRLYQFICEQFFASISGDIIYEDISYKFNANGVMFSKSSNKIIDEGFLLFQPFKRKNYVKDFPSLKQNDKYNIVSTGSDEHWTEPPDYLTEADLISEMEKNHIGTDASMSVHIENICQRGYVKVDEGRRLKPSQLGRALINALGSVDPEIIHPENRAKIEDFVNQVAHGKKSYKDTLNYALEIYKQKYMTVRVHFDKMLEVFRKYFKIDSYALSKASKDVKDKNEKYKKQMFHQKSEKEAEDQILGTCDECNKGKMYFEYDKFDKFCLFCTGCKRRTKIIRDAIKINVVKDKICDKCSCFYINVEVENPFLNGETDYTGCLFCDSNLS